MAKQAKRVPAGKRISKVPQTSSRKNDAPPAKKVKVGKRNSLAKQQAQNADSQVPQQASQNTLVGGNSV